jgi:hypothetical protein
LLVELLLLLRKRQFDVCAVCELCGNCFVSAGMASDMFDEIERMLVPVQGRAIAQAASRWLPTAAARVRVLAKHVGFVVHRGALGQVFSEYFGFPCQSFHQFLHHNHSGLAQ